MIVVRFPTMLQAAAGGEELVLREPLADVGALLAALGRRSAALGRALDDPMFNVAVNDELLLHGVRRHPLKDGDRVEFVPTIAGG